jgi:hypothetical protein
MLEALKVIYLVAGLITTYCFHAVVRHASCTTAWTEASSLATEAGQVFMTTFSALHPQEAVLQATAFEVIGKFLLYAQWQGLVLRGHHISERRVIPLNDLIVKCPFWPMTLIGRAMGRPIRDRCLRHSVLHSMVSLIFS